MKECKRLLNSKGILIISTDNVMNIWNRIAMIIGDTKEINRYFNGMFEYGTLRYFTPKGLKYMLEINGFRIEKMIPLGRLKLLGLCGGFLCIAR